VKYLITNTELSGQQVDIAIADGQIAEIGKGLASDGFTVVDGKGTVALQGLVDLHTHLREPGKEDSETVASGSLAAVTKGLEGKELAELGAMADSTAQVRVFSDDGHCVSDALVMRRALEYIKKFDGVIAQHAQDPQLTIDAQMNEGLISSQLGLKGWPAVAEEAIIARDVLLADHVKSRLHICHLTTAGGVEIIRWAKARGIDVTAEVTPHHLLLTDDLATSYDPVYKVNPPLRTEKDVMALREGLADGTIDIVATDHAPHPAESKECEWQYAAFGMLGLETALSIVWQTMIESKLMSIESLQARMSTKPAEIGRYHSQGKALVKGAPANLTLFAPNRPWKVDRDLVASKSKNTPFHGMQFGGSVVATYFEGRESWRAN
jgi:dihydroorotase